MNRLFNLYSLGLLILFSYVSGAGEEYSYASMPTPSEKEVGSCEKLLIEKVENRYEKVRDLSAKFVQRSTSIVLGGVTPKDAESTGTVVFAKPSLMRWQYEDPEPSTIVSDGTSLWIYDPTFHEVQVMPLTSDYLFSIGLNLLLGSISILDTFTVTSERCGEEMPRLFLDPLLEASYQLLEIVVEAETGTVRGMVINDLFGNRTELDLYEITSNNSPATETFRFKIPSGARIFRIEPSQGKSR